MAYIRATVLRLYRFQLLEGPAAKVNQKKSRKKKGEQNHGAEGKFETCRASRLLVHAYVEIIRGSADDANCSHGMSA